MKCKLSIMIILSTIFSATGGEARPYILGVVPQQGPYVMHKRWQPFISSLSKHSGLEIHFRTEHSIPTFEKEFLKGTYDIAYMNPYHYILARKKQGYIPVLRSNKLIVGILVVRKGSAIRNISDLKGKTFLFPSPLAFAATLVTKYELKSKYGIDVDREEKYLYVNSHDSVYKGVAREVGDVGGGIERTFFDLRDQATREKLRILHRTSPYPGHPFTIHPRIPPEERRKIVQAFLKIPERYLHNLRIQKLVPTSNREYDTIRRFTEEIDSLSQPLSSAPR